MDKTNGKLTVYFEEPFWVGVFVFLPQIFCDYSGEMKIHLTPSLTTMALKRALMI